MPSNYKNQSLMIPFRLWVMPEQGLFRVEIPSLAMTTNTEWIFDDRISSIKEWKPWKEGNPYLYGISIASYPPRCKGTDLVAFVQNDKHPYNTELVVLGAYLEREEVTVGPFKGREVDQMYMFQYSVPNTTLLFLWAHLDMYNQLSFNLMIDPHIDDYEKEKRAVGKWIHLTLYPLLSEMDYWKSTTESLCIPTEKCSHHNKSCFNTLRECQQKTYDTIRNRHTWVENNSEPIYQYMKWWKKQSTDTKLRSLEYKQYEK